MTQSLLCVAVLTVASIAEYQFEPYITCWEQSEYSYWGYRDPEYQENPEFPDYQSGDVCDHTDPTIGELRDTCFFEVRIADEYWSRKCTHHSNCPKGPNACNFDDPKRIVCCCQEDYCNTFVEYAKKGYADPLDAPELNEQGKIAGSGGSGKGGGKDKSSKSGTKGNSKSRANSDFGEVAMLNQHATSLDAHESNSATLTIAVLATFALVACLSCYAGLCIGERLKTVWWKAQQQRLARDEL